jgi:polysaccharide biosynthesis/export protein
MGSSRVIGAWLLSVVASWGIAAAVASDAAADSPTKAGVAPPDAYELKPGDVLEISVWKESDLQRDALIRPDGSFTFPLAGEIDARGKTVEDVHKNLVDRLQKFVPTPVVTVAVKSIAGNRVYVVGKVNRAGDFPLVNPIDVMQAISLAGGTTPYAAVNDIVILRRQNGRQQAFSFHYSDVSRGRNLSQNIQLQGGDTVVVP